MDLTFREDQNRVRKNHGPQNMATLRQISHNLLKRETSLKVGIQSKRLKRDGKRDGRRTTSSRSSSSKAQLPWVSRSGKSG